MTVTVTVRNTGPQMFQRLKAKVPAAIAKSLNRAAVSARTVMVREMAADLALPVKKVLAKTHIQLARPEQHHAQFTAGRKPFSLVKDFAARGPEPSRGRGRGVTYRLGRLGRVLVEGAFIATMRSSHKGVYRRKGRQFSRTGVISARKSVGAWSKNLPIQEVPGPSLVPYFMKARPRGIAAAQESFNKNLQSEFRFALSRAA